MFGGGVGNLIDRVLFENGVIDFLNVGIGNLRTGIFNVADMAIMTGVVGFFVFGRPVENEGEKYKRMKEKKVIEHDTAH